MAVMPSMIQRISSMSQYACLSVQELCDGHKKIRPVIPEDIEPIRLWRNAQLKFLRQTQPLSAQQQQQYYEHRIWPSMALAQPDQILMSYLDNEQLIGYGGLVHIHWQHQRAEVSLLLDPVRKTTAINHQQDMIIFFRLIQQLAFAVIGLNRLCTETYAIRTDVIAVYPEVNFQLEGVLREHVMIEGQGIDALIHGCLRSERQ